LRKLAVEAVQIMATNPIGVGLHSRALRPDKHRQTEYSSMKNEVANLYQPLPALARKFVARQQSKAKTTEQGQGSET